MTSDPEPTNDASRQARQPRQSVFLNATLERFGGGAATKHRVRDLSVGGMRIDQAVGLQAGATVVVTVGNLQAVGATVAWVRDGWAGLKFAVPIDPDQARSKAAVAPKVADPIPKPASGIVPTAGWIKDLNSPYRGKP
jgi:hypothetical protein